MDEESWSGAAVVVVVVGGGGGGGGAAGVVVVVIIVTNEAQFKIARAFPGAVSEIHRYLWCQ